MNKDKYKLGVKLDTSGFSTTNIRPENIKDVLLYYSIKNKERRKLDAELKGLSTRLKEAMGKGNIIKVNNDISYKASVSTSEVPDMEKLLDVARSIDPAKYIVLTEVVDIEAINTDVLNGVLDGDLFSECFTTKEVVSLIEVKPEPIEINYTIKGARRWQKK